MFLNKKTALKIALYYMSRKLSRKRNDVLRGALAGAIGGLAGSGVMKMGEMVLSHVRQNGGGSPQQVREQSIEQDPAVKVAAAATQKMTHREPGEKSRKLGGALVHYGFGTGVGALYGAVSELAPASGYAAGAPFGAAVWAAADLAAVPVFGLSQPPNRIPLKQHAQMLGMHVAYGLTTETVRRYMRHVI